MKRRDFTRFALGIGLSPIVANAQIAGQTETFAQPLSKNIVAGDPIAAVRKYVDAFNQGDAAVMATTFTVPGSILDGMAPHVWGQVRRLLDIFTGATSFESCVLRPTWASYS